MWCTVHTFITHLFGEKSCNFSTPKRSDNFIKYMVITIQTYFTQIKNIKSKADNCVAILEGLVIYHLSIVFSMLGTPFKS